ncbi:MAG: hypothetical protein OIF38_01980 [Cellvibrionaceae bacterium]|nr:hypothetical protein [Cellvibrionaceae bacterium]
MKQEELTEVLTCLGDERRILHYFRDRYCFDLIEFELAKYPGQSASIAQLRSSSVGRFLQKPTVSEALKHCANGHLQQSDIQCLWPLKQWPLAIRLASWGNAERGWDQTSRNQKNLVLQVNFDGWHDQQYRRLIKPLDGEAPFACYSHPVDRQGRNTMAWARLDINLDTDEVLIEEIQSDWFRGVAGNLRKLKRGRARDPKLAPWQINCRIGADYKDFIHYAEQILSSYQKLWAEATMLAALRFIRDELGVSNVFYHSFETGAKLKDVCGLPPKSIYSKLPKQFGFSQTNQVPEMLARDKFARRCIKAIKQPSWYQLCL